MQVEDGVVYIRVSTLLEFSQVALYSKVHLIANLVDENSVDHYLLIDIDFYNLKKLLKLNVIFSVFQKSIITTV